MYRTSKVAVVVPAFNEQAHIGKVLSGMPELVDVVYVVDDASTDGTADIVRGAAGLEGSGLRVPGWPASRGFWVQGSGFWVRVADGNPLTRQPVNPRVELIQHAANRGVGAAIVTGYKRAVADGMDIVAVMAGDNQMEPEWLPAVLDPVALGHADYAKGTRQTNVGHLRGMSPWRLIGNFTLRWLTAIASGNPNITDPQHGYAAISRETLQALDLDAVYPYYGYCNDLVVRLSAQHRRIVEVPMPAMYHGEVSKIRYHTYIPRVSMLLLRLFVWRVAGRLNRAARATPMNSKGDHTHESTASVAAHR